MILAIAELDCSGHHMLHVRRIVREANTRGISVVLFTGEASLKHNIYLDMQREAADMLQTYIIDPKPASNWRKSSNPIRKQVGYWLCMYHISRFINSLPKHSRPDFIFVPFLDSCDKAISVLGTPFGYISWAGLVMQIKFHYQDMGVIRPPSKSDGIMKWMYVRLLRSKNLRVLFTLDEPLDGYTKKRYSTLSSLVQYVPDPAEFTGNISKEESRDIFGIPNDDTVVVLVFGSISVHKGLPALVEAINSGTLPTNVKIFIVGLQDPSAHASLAKISESAMNSGKIIEVDRFVSDFEEHAAFKASDIIWVVRLQYYGSSGVMIQAGKMKLPMIGSRSGVVGWAMTKYDAGIVVDETSGTEVADAISRLTSDKALYQTLAENSEKLAHNHTDENFKNTILDRIVSASKNHVST